MSGYDPDNRFVVVAKTQRRWSRAEKLAVVTGTAGASVSAVAQTWDRLEPCVALARELGGGVQMWNPGAATAFVPMALPAPPVLPVCTAVAGSRMIEIELAHGHRVRVDSHLMPRSPDLHQKLEHEASHIHRA